MRISAIPYRSDSADLFEVIADEPWAVFLDSGRPYSNQGRYDIMAARPMATLASRGRTTEIRQWDGASSLSSEDPFDLLRACLAPDGTPSELPFCGGAIGYFGYDLARRLESLEARATDAEGIPEMAVGIYDWALVVDHLERTSHLVAYGRDPRVDAMWDDLVGRFSAPSATCHRAPFQAGKISCNFDSESYGRAFDRIQHYIAEGDCYQVNLAQRFEADASGDHWSGYRDLRRANPAPYAAYLNHPAARILSCSPECFLSVRRGQVETRPIKGTRPRSAVPDEDSALAAELAGSLKDRAENLMIVDLLRNDLGKVCVPGSVAVPELFAIESFAGVHHLVSTVTGCLASGMDAIRLLRAAFPGGSITGAPKLSAMQIIEELVPDHV